MSDNSTPSKKGLLQIESLIHLSGDKDINAQILSLHTSKQGGIVVEQKEFIMIGVEHTRDIESPTSKLVKQTLEQYFNEDAELSHRVVMVEGRADQLTYTNEEDALARAHEAGLATQMARGRNVRVISPEPAREQEIAILRQSGFHDNEIVAFYIIRGLTEMMTSHQPSTDVQLAKLIYDNFLLLDKEKSDTPLSQAVSAMHHWISNLTKSEIDSLRGNESSPTPSVRVVQQLRAHTTVLLAAAIPVLNSVVHEALSDDSQLITQLPDETVQIDYTKEFLRGIIDQGTPGSIIDAGTKHEQPTPETIFRHIAQELTLLRDKTLLRAIIGAIHEGNRPCIVFGATHVLNIASALKSFLNQN